MDDATLAQRVVEHMRSTDGFSRWMGLELVHLAPGQATLRMTVRKDMLNAFGMIHGGVTFSLADSAYGFAANTHGRHSVSLEGGMSFTKPAREGDVLTATARELHRGHHLMVYDVDIVNQQGVRIAMFRGSQYQLDQEHFPKTGPT